MDRYTTETGGHPWTTEEEDICLDELLALTRPGQLGGTLDRLAARLGRGNRRGALGQPNGDLVRRHVLWGLACRITEYTGPIKYRIPRGAHVPVGFIEEEIIVTALKSKSDEAAAKRSAPPDAAYLARLLQRPEEWIECQMRRLDPTRQFMGLGLVPGNSTPLPQ